jgi:hypothetical protein
MFGDGERRVPEYLLVLRLENIASGLPSASSARALKRTRKGVHRGEIMGERKIDTRYS